MVRIQNEARGTAFCVVERRGGVVPMTVPPATSAETPAATQFVLRQRDRRRGIDDLFRGLSRALEQRNEGALVRGTFEEWLRRTIRVRAVRLREAEPPWSDHSGPAPE